MARHPIGAAAGSKSTSSSRAAGARQQRGGQRRRSGVAPRKRFGQNFLIDQSVLDRIVAALELGGDETVIEVGPGTGALTERLVPAAGRVIAVEVDRRLWPELRARFGERLVLVEGDVLAIEPVAMLAEAGLQPRTPYLVAGNLPYNIGSAILRHFLEAENPPRHLVVMLQREVAASLTAPDGDSGLLAIATRVFAQPRRLFNVPPGAFFPRPKVTSSVVRLDVRPEPLVPGEEQPRFFEVVRAGFSNPRKQLHNALENGLGLTPVQVRAALARAGVDGSLRAGRLSIEDWRRLALALKEDPT
jgi:16S rRNA (adenine1518-N6/adenine1519-N6)-dimethyltransferase